MQNRPQNYLRWHKAMHWRIESSNKGPHGDICYLIVFVFFLLLFCLFVVCFSSWWVCLLWSVWVMPCAMGPAQANSPRLVMDKLTHCLPVSLSPSSALSSSSSTKPNQFLSQYTTLHSSLSPLQESGWDALFLWCFSGDIIYIFAILTQI